MGVLHVSPVTALCLSWALAIAHASLMQRPTWRAHHLSCTLHAHVDLCFWSVQSSLPCPLPALPHDMPPWWSRDFHRCGLHRQGIGLGVYSTQCVACARPGRPEGRECAAEVGHDVCMGPARLRVQAGGFRAVPRHGAQPHPRLHRHVWHCCVSAAPLASVTNFRCKTEAYRLKALLAFPASAACVQPSAMAGKSMCVCGHFAVGFIVRLTCLSSLHMAG